MSTSVTTAGQISFSTLRTTTNALSSSPEALQASTTADAAETGTCRQQVIDILTEKLAVYSEQYHQILTKGILIDTTPAQNMLKSSLSQLMNIGATSEDNSGEPSQDSANVKLSWDITFDKNMDKDGDGKIDDDIDFSTYIWSNDNDHGDGVSYPESDWEIYANIGTELSNLQTGYMDVYTDLAKQSVEFLDDVNSFKARMVTYISSSKDKMKIDVGGVQDELDAIIDGWGIYNADGNINTTPINPATTAGPYPDRGPVAIRGLDAQGVYYWAEQLELSDQLQIETHIEAGADGKMAIDTGNPGDDIDNITVADSVANLVEPPEEDCRLYLQMEADGTYTLYVYPDLQPVRDAKEATYSLMGYRSDAGSSTAAEAPTASELGLPPDDARYTGNTKGEKSYVVIPTSKDMVIPPITLVTAAGFHIPDGYTLITSSDTEDYHEYDLFLIPTDMLDPPKTNSEAGDSNASVHVTESVVVIKESYDLNGKGGEQANIYVSPASTWDFDGHNADEFATISSSLFNSWENSMNTMSSTVESQSQVMSEKLSQANTIFNNLTKVLSSTIEALQETQKEFLK